MMSSRQHRQSNFLVSVPAILLFVYQKDVALCGNGCEAAFNEIQGLQRAVAAPASLPPSPATATDGLSCFHLCWAGGFPLCSLCLFSLLVCFFCESSWPQRRRTTWAPMHPGYTAMPSPPPLPFPLLPFPAVKWKAKGERVSAEKKRERERGKDWKCALPFSPQVRGTAIAYPTSVCRSFSYGTPMASGYGYGMPATYAAVAPAYPMVARPALAGMGYGGWAGY